MQTDPAWALLFPGLGSQYVGMGRGLGDRFDIAAQTFAEADEILGFHLSRLCFEGPENKLNEIANAHPALLAVSIAAWRVLSVAASAPLVPTAIAGHSLGEFAALVAAGCLSFADAVYLVREQGLILQRIASEMDSGMLAIMAADLTDIQSVIERIRTETGCIVEIANDNCPGQLVLGGHRLALKCVQEMYSPKVAFCEMLKVNAPMHTSLMRSACQAFQAVLGAVRIDKPAIPVVGNVSADWLHSAIQVWEELSDQLTHTVRWTESVRRMGADTRIGIVVEVGPGRILRRLMRRIDRMVRCASFGDNPEDLEGVTKLLRGS